uniref:G_PROTEIN_RECEP_F1_2 domain-containing protein n=1 Tax=Steinernema glaseri TaxID=37863 RepID=A0A1I7XYP8_9BILA
GYRQYVAGTYIAFNIVGFALNVWVAYVVAPLLTAQRVRVPKAILFYILILCISDLMTMIGMLFLITEVVLGTWMFSSFACTAYLIFDSMNKFVAPIIVVLISRTCYATVCLDKDKQENAASLKQAIALVFASLCVVMALLWPVFAYSEVFTLYFNVNETAKEVNVMRKCSFLPPPSIELGFSVVACTLSYAIPLFGIIYWYVSVPFFLRKRAGESLVQRSFTAEAAIKKVVATVIVLTAVYVVCWTPYWISLFAHRIFATTAMNRTLVILSYLIHLLPYVSCVAYPVIFTVMNRGIKAAHAEVLKSHKRKLLSIKDEAGHQIRVAVRGATSRARGSDASRLCSGIIERSLSSFNNRVEHCSYSTSNTETATELTVPNLELEETLL